MPTPDPTPLSALATTPDGRVLGWTDPDACRAWLAANEGWTVWTAAGFWARERDARRGEFDPGDPAIPSAYCEHGVIDGDWCPACNAAAKAARAENGD